MGQKLKSKIVQDNFFGATIADLRENSKIEDKFFKKILILTKNKKNLFFGSKMGGQLIHGIDLYTGKYSMPFLMTKT